MAYKYKLKEGHTPETTFIPGVAISADGTVESETIIESPVLEFVSADQPTEQVAAAPVAAPAPAPVAAPAPAVTTQTTKEQN